MFTFDLAEHLQGTRVTVNCIRFTNVQIDPERYEYLTGWKRRAYEIKRKKGITPGQMAEAYIRLAIAPEFQTITGNFFDEDCNEVMAYKRTYDQAIRKKLWDASVEMTHLK
jgi:hypothetical protein